MSALMTIWSGFSVPSIYSLPPEIVIRSSNGPLRSKDARTFTGVDGHCFSLTALSSQCLGLEGSETRVTPELACNCCHEMTRNVDAINRTRFEEMMGIASYILRNFLTYASAFPFGR